MRKFLAVVKREYLKLVWSKMFLIGTLLAPVMAMAFTFIPALMFSIEGSAVKIGIVDQSGKLFESVNKNLTTRPKIEAPDLEKQMSASSEERAKQTGEAMISKFAVEKIEIGDKSIEQIKRGLNERLREQKNLDVYVIIPANFDQSVELYAANTSDFVSQSRIERALTQAVRESRMADSDISQEKLDAINRELKFNTTRVSESGESSDNGESFIFLFIVGLMIYLVLTIYGQTILAAVVEEKETKIAEILFSSARPFTLMMGKLVGVGLVALTQLAIWVLSGAAILIFGITQMQRSGIEFSLPAVSPFFIAGLFVFFLIGFFTYATIYALIGSAVTTVQEGGQFALFPTLFLLGGFYCVFPIIRSPNSDFSVWISMMPFLSPILMPVRMAINTPPLWQIALAMFLGIAAIVALTWLAARTYRVGMLMTGKKATIPEIFKWIRQS